MCTICNITTPTFVHLHNIHDKHVRNCCISGNVNLHVSQPEMSWQILHDNSVLLTTTVPSLPVDGCTWLNTSVDYRLFSTDRCRLRRQNDSITLDNLLLIISVSACKLSEDISQKYGRDWQTPSYHLYSEKVSWTVYGRKDTHNRV